MIYIKKEKIYFNNIILYYRYICLNLLGLYDKNYYVEDQTKIQRKGGENKTEVIYYRQKNYSKNLKQ